MASNVTNVVVAGLGGQGVLKAAAILARAAFRSGLDVKKSETHGMSRRGGSVTSGVRFGERVLSPTVPPGEADYLLILDPGEVDVNRDDLRAGGVLIGPDLLDGNALPDRKRVNVALLGALSAYLHIDREAWLAAVRDHLPEALHDVNVRAFATGLAAAEKRLGGVQEPHANAESTSSDPAGR